MTYFFKFFIHSVIFILIIFLIYRRKFCDGHIILVYYCKASVKISSFFNRNFLQHYKYSFVRSSVKGTLKQNYSKKINEQLLVGDGIHFLLLLTHRNMTHIHLFVLHCLQSYFQANCDSLNFCRSSVSFRLRIST